MFDIVHERVVQLAYPKKDPRNMILEFISPICVILQSPLSDSSMEHAVPCIIQNIRLKGRDVLVEFYAHFPIAENRNCYIEEPSLTFAY